MDEVALEDGEAVFGIASLFCTVVFCAGECAFRVVDRLNLRRAAFVRIVLVTMVSSDPSLVASRIQEEGRSSGQDSSSEICSSNERGVAIVPRAGRQSGMRAVQG